MSTSSAPPVVTFGETMALFRTLESGPLAHTATVGLGIGGAESNVAIGLNRLGTPAVWCGRVGEDPLGELVTRELRAECTRLHVTRDPAAPTGLMVKTSRTPGTQQVTYYRSGSAGSRLQPEDIDRALLEKAALLHITGITPALSSSACDTVDYAIQTAREAGVPVSFDLNYRSRLWSHSAAREAYRRIIPNSDVVFAGEDEAALLSGPQDSVEGLASAIAAMGPSQVVIKRGAAGAIAHAGGILHAQSAIPVSAVDTVGAGDAFVAGYLSEWLAGASVECRLQTGAACGAFACLTRGDWEGLPTRSELALLQPTETVIR